MPPSTLRSCQRLCMFVLLFVIAFVPFASTQAAPVTQRTANALPTLVRTTRPLEITIAATPAKGATATVTVTLHALSAVDTINLQFAVEPGLTVVATTVPTQTVLAANATRSFTAVVAGMTDTPKQVGVLAWGNDNQRTFTQQEILRLSSVNQQLSSQLVDGDAQPNNANPANSTSDTPTPTPEPGDQVLTMRISGQFRYNDHVTRPVSTVVLTAPEGLDPAATLKPIRQAWVHLQHRIDYDNNPNTAWVTDDATYTDDTGAFAITGTVTVNPAAYTTQIRAIVCTVGPDANQRIKVKGGPRNPSVLSEYHCLSSEPFAPTAERNLGTIDAEDSRLDSAPWNIYDVALESFTYLKNEIGPPTDTLRIDWTKDGQSIFTPGVSSYLDGKVTLNGTLADGDQWNDAVIAHEIGHWVMDHYADFPATYLAPHGECKEGNLGMQYSEAWANFFMAASRTKSRDAENRRWAAYYIDAQDDNPAYVGPNPRPAYQGFTRLIETPNVVDTSRPADESFRRGNFCEWSITATLWDIFDTPAMNDGEAPAGEAWDTINRPFADIFTAFRAQLPFTSGAKYPQDINHWWYNWTNTLNSRPGDTSLGDEQAIQAIFAHHDISTGFRVALGWTDPAADLDAHLWLPDATPAHVFYEQPGSLTAAPFTALDRTVQPAR